MVLPANKWFDLVDDSSAISKHGFLEICNQVTHCMFKIFLFSIILSAYLNIFLLFRRDVLNHLIEMHNYSNQFLPHALRRFFQILQAPNQLDSYLHFLLEKFSARFCQCNPNLQLSSGEF